MNWDDPSFRQKVSSRPPAPRKRLRAEGEEVKQPMICTNCKKPFSSLAVDHCKCPIWTVGL